MEGYQAPTPIPQPAYAPPPPPAPMPAYAPAPAPTMSDGGSMGASEGTITKEIWIGFLFAFLAGVGIGYIYTQNKKLKFPKLI